MKLSISFKEYAKVGDHIEYIVEVSNTQSMESWKFQRRYSVLRQVYANFKNVVGETYAFPPKKMFGNKDPGFVEQRKKMLEKYFSDVLKVQGILDNEVCKSFFIPGDKVALVTAAPVKSEVKKPVVKKDNEREIKEASKKITDVVSTKLIDLSAQGTPLDDYELKKQVKLYEHSCKEIRLNFHGFLPEGRDINSTYYESPIMKDQVMEKYLNATLLKATSSSYAIINRFLD